MHRRLERLERRGSRMAGCFLVAMLGAVGGPVLAQDRPTIPTSQSTVTVTPKPEGTPASTVQLKPGEVPKMKLDSLEYQFPRTPTGQDVHHEFRFTNEGNGTLEILSVQPSCGCTTTGDYDKIIPPGGKGRIPLVLSTAKFSGYLNKTVKVITNMPEPHSVVTLAMKGEVWEPLTCVPKTLGFGRVSVQSLGNGPPIQRLTIINNAPTEAKLNNLRSSNAAFKGKINILEPGKKFELEATLAPPYQGGVVNGIFDLDTGVPEMIHLEIPVSVYLAADIEVFPARLPLPANRANDIQRQFNVMNNNASKPIKLTEAVCTNAALKPRIEEVRPGFSFKVVLDIPKSCQIRRSGDAVIVKTDSPATPQIVIPIVESKLSGGEAPIPINPEPPPVHDPASPPTEGK